MNVLLVYECALELVLCSISDEVLNVSVYDEPAGDNAAVLGEIDSGAELIVTGLYKPFL